MGKCQRKGKNSPFGPVFIIDKDMRSKLYEIFTKHRKSNEYLFSHTTVKGFAKTGKMKYDKPVGEGKLMAMLR